MTHRASDKARADHAEAAARREFRLGRATLAAFLRAVRAWRAAALTGAAGAGARADWLMSLRV